MAMTAPSRKDIGERFRWLLQASGMTGRAFTDALGEGDYGIATKMKHGESLTLERLIASSVALKGRGQLVDDEHALMNFLVWGGDPRSVLRPHLRLVEDDSQPDNPTGSEVTSKPYVKSAAVVIPIDRQGREKPEAA